MLLLLVLLITIVLLVGSARVSVPGKGISRNARRSANRPCLPSGYRTLQTVLQVEDMDAFKTQWQAYVLKLRLP